MKRLAAGVALGVVLLGALWAAVRALRPATDRPNVIIVVWDTVRADRTSLYGHHRPTTPTLERLAEDSVVYGHAIASSEWTGPTHASLFTGLPLRTHGMDTYYKWLDGHYTTLAEHLAAQGYATYAFTGNRFVSDFVNLLQGFEVTDHTFKGRYKKAARKATSRKLIPRDRSTEISPAWQPDGHGDGWSKKLTLFKDAAPLANRALARWLDEDKPSGQPFFAFVNLMEAHQPRIPSMASRRALLKDAEIELALSTDSSLFALMSYMHGKRAYTDAELQAMAGTYDAALLDLDNALAGLLELLEERGLRDDTVIVITSDHGEMLGEHGLYSHRWALYEPLVHVPLVVHHPGKLEPRRVSQPVSVAGVPNTVCELLDVPPLPDAMPSLVRPPAGPVFSELRDPNKIMDVVARAYPGLVEERFERSLHAVIQGTEKLIRASDHRHELYDLAADPMETTDLAATRPERVEALSAIIEAWEDATPQYDPAKRAPSDNRKQLTDPETRRMLEILGYASDE